MDGLECRIKKAIPLHEILMPQMRDADSLAAISELIV
jgi:hypothetical protein